jgi:hypothetical protein
MRAELRGAVGQVRGRTGGAILFRIMPSQAIDKVLAVTDNLRAVLNGRPADARRDKALYHIDRLQKAFTASHQEAVRFAAFTVNKTIRDAADWDLRIAEAMDALRAALAEAGHEF